MAELLFLLLLLFFEIVVKPIIFIALCYVGSAYVHELGHIVALKCYKINIYNGIRGIKSNGFGLYIVIPPEKYNNRSRRQQIIMHLCGPIAGTIFSILFMLLILYTQKSYLGFCAIPAIFINLASISPSHSDGSKIWKKD